jgi:hypothetical protein
VTFVVTVDEAPSDASLASSITLDVGITAAQIPVAVVRIPRLPSTSTGDEVQLAPFALFLALVGGLLITSRRRDATDDDSVIAGAVH